MITLAPELENSPEVIKNLTDNGVTVSLGNLKTRVLFDSLLICSFFAI